MKVNQASAKGINLIKKYEGLSLKPYKCPAGLATIGYGATYYPNGIKVKLTDKPISEYEASTMLSNMLRHYEQGVDSYTRDDITQGQFDALVSFAYNCGLGNLKSSTLLKKVNANPNDPSIRQEFLKWNKGGGKALAGLTKRRTEEANLYYES
jgi:lysozyme